jgi:hypothetical protein
LVKLKQKFLVGLGYWTKAEREFAGLITHRRGF